MMRCKVLGGGVIFRTISGIVLRTTAVPKMPCISLTYYNTKIWEWQEDRGKNGGILKLLPAMQLSRQTSINPTTVPKHIPPPLLLLPSKVLDQIFTPSLAIGSEFCRPAERGPAFGWSTGWQGGGGVAAAPSSSSPFLGCHLILHPSGLARERHGEGAFSRGPPTGPHLPGPQLKPL